MLKSNLGESYYQSVFCLLFFLPSSQFGGDGSKPVHFEAVPWEPAVGQENWFQRGDQDLLMSGVQGRIIMTSETN